MFSCPYLAMIAGKESFNPTKPCGSLFCYAGCDSAISSFFTDCNVITETVLIEI